MVVRIDMDMPRMCVNCRLMITDSNKDKCCVLLPIMDMDNNPTGLFQKVNSVEEVFDGTRSKHCPLKEIKE